CSSNTLPGKRGVALARGDLLVTPLISSPLLATPDNWLEYWTSVQAGNEVQSATRSYHLDDVDDDAPPPQPRLCKARHYQMPQWTVPSAAIKKILVPVTDRRYRNSLIFTISTVHGRTYVSRPRRTLSFKSAKTANAARPKQAIERSVMFADEATVIGSGKKPALPPRRATIQGPHVPVTSNDDEGIGTMSNSQGAALPESSLGHLASRPLPHHPPPTTDPPALPPRISSNSNTKPRITIPSPASRAAAATAAILGTSPPNTHPPSLGAVLQPSHSHPQVLHHWAAIGPGVPLPIGVPRTLFFPIHSDAKPTAPLASRRRKKYAPRPIRVPPAPKNKQRVIQVVPKHLQNAGRELPPSQRASVDSIASTEVMPRGAAPVPHQAPIVPARRTSSMRSVERLVEHQQHQYPSRSESLRPVQPQSQPPLAMPQPQPLGGTLARHMLPIGTLGLTSLNRRDSMLMPPSTNTSRRSVVGMNLGLGSWNAPPIPMPQPLMPPRPTQVQPIAGSSGQQQGAKPNVAAMVMAGSRRGQPQAAAAAEQPGSRLSLHELIREQDEEKQPGDVSIFRMWKALGLS
ncbi:hypothetical protein BCR44DRAFT_1423766, partial [Catenaria anguillulae PL171]